MRLPSPTRHPTRRPATVRPSPLLLLVLLLAVPAGCATGPPTATQRAVPVRGVHDVIAKNLRFQPAAIQVPVGTTVTWHIDDGGVPHNITAQSFASPRSLTRTTWRHTFDRSGTFSYKCTLHAGMAGRVVVTG